jgi:DNA (cytosine-5)-methyltransferase 3A
LNVLSLFDGISCGQIALERAGFKVDNYYASEIDKHAIKVTQHNYPGTIQLGDVTKVNGGSLPKIDILIGGSPCQGFSFAGKQLNFDDPRSKLFFEYVRILKECREKNPDISFLLENVKMKKESELVISETLGVEPIKINSALVSAQNRERLYWTNIPNVEQPKDRKIDLQEILDEGRQTNGMNKSYCLLSTFYKENIKSILQRKKRGLYCFDESGNPSKFSVEECERLQTLPTGYTKLVSKTSRYAVIGNGWTVDVISHILSYKKVTHI